MTDAGPQIIEHGRGTGLLLVMGALALFWAGLIVGALRIM